MNEIISRLSNDGWKLNSFKANNFISTHNVNTKYDDVKSLFLMNDLKLFSEPWLDISHKTEVECDGIVQINKVRNVAAPEVDQESKNNTPLYKYIVSDGQTSVPMIDLRSGNAFRHSVSLGGKIYLKGKISHKSGMMILTSKDNGSVRYLGGQILDLIKTESFNQNSKNRRIVNREDGPPRFVPFGEKLQVNVQEMNRFKALQDDSVKGAQAADVKNKDSEFGNLRDAEIKKARNQVDNSNNASSENKRTENVQTAGDLLSKFHRGGTSKFVKNTMERQDLLDSHLAELMKHGFSIGASKKALENSAYDLSAALDKLSKGSNGSQSGLSQETRLNQSDTNKSQKNKWKGKGGNNADDLEDDPWFDPARYAEQVGLQSKPHTTIDLQDVLTAKSNHSTPLKQHTTYQMQPGDDCQAQCIDGSYQNAVVVDILEGHGVRVKYKSGRYEGEVMDVVGGLLRRGNGERVKSHMIPSYVGNDLIGVNSNNNFSTERGSYPRGRGGFRRRAGGRRGGRGGRGRRPAHY